MQHFKTILGNVPIKDLGIALPHEHICCYFEYFYKMLGRYYLDKNKLAANAAEHLSYMKKNYSLSTVVDCTPVNIGRDIELLKNVSKQSGVNIVCSTGFYYTEEIMLNDISLDYIHNAVLRDAKSINAGLIKFAVEDEKITVLGKKILTALCEAQKVTKLPLCIHTNGENKNGAEVLELALKNGVAPEYITIGHLSDAHDMDYITEIAKTGCFIGFDRIYKGDTAYYRQKARDIYTLSERGFANQILLSHDGLVFNGFSANAKIRQDNPYQAIFKGLLPQMLEVGFTPNDIDRFMTKNPENMLLAYGV